MLKFKPMLADDANLELLKFPIIVSPKLDGVRVTFVNGKLLTRSLKSPGNKTLAQATFPVPLDGELIVGDPNGKSVFRDTMKIISAHNADIKDVKLHVFDMVDTEMPFVDRLKIAQQNISDPRSFLCPVPHMIVRSEIELLAYEEACITEGFEGVMIRDPLGKYKFGRSTVAEGGLLKLKRRLQSEAVVLNFEEQMHNANEAKINALGYTERTSHQANKMPTGVLGALVVKDLKTSVEFNVGTGFDAAERAEIWKNRDTYKGMIITYEFLPVGVKDKPRHPTFLGWRAAEDL